LVQLPLYISAPAVEHWDIAERRVRHQAQHEAFAELEIQQVYAAVVGSHLVEKGEANTDKVYE